MSPSLVNFLLSLVAGGLVVGLGAGALTLISRIDRIR
ncbi:photosystem II reaction center protein PsbX [Anthocerotibacter panamensis]|nr:photosystem II reaction center protein PsbX [Anthocerotibacter panamensis]